MNTTNQRFFQIFGLDLLGVGAFALVNANGSWVNANTEETQTSQSVSASNTYSRRRHTISLTLNKLDDLKQGQTCISSMSIAPHMKAAYAKRSLSIVDSKWSKRQIYSRLNKDVQSTLQLCLHHNQLI